MCQVSIKREGADIVQWESQLAEQRCEGKNGSEVQRGMAETSDEGMTQEDYLKAL